ncbi:double-strand break repair protein AddB [Sulfitobacter sp. TSTF-M16]|uniref:Double-strand break repair protein AddB n=1 Tax=Sulfitobacter aestuariivivens TaxID=2766981 RepID=A0A927HEW1_9RHOB|nr:double-strand break repair protein AddB [Sulfitobacter aestuariivivens]MBD3665212.1 double-strand break repair protein AddB [Sulfitobacter aestuariivivens]
MFEPSDHPRVFGLAPGVDFPAALVAGLRDKLQGHPPDAMARVDLIVNTRRMQRRLREIFDAGPAGFLPRIRLLTELDGLVKEVNVPPAVSPLRRRLELVQLVSMLLEADPSLAPRTSLYALADSLAALLDEMQGEGVEAQAIKALDVTDQSGHWERAKKFLTIAQDYLDQSSTQLDSETRQRKLITTITGHWQRNPPKNPVILAGSTGSRGTTMMLMQAIATLPQGAVVLPGFDWHMSSAIWQDLDPQNLPQDHPQYRFFHLMQALSLPASKVENWARAEPPSADRNALISLSLRPAPVTHAWLKEGPHLGNLPEATQDVTLVEAPTPRIEALCIAMRLRKAAEEGQTAALITPDRMLTRQVTSALDRWNILPDDSAGMPLQLSPPGRFLRHVAGLMRRKLDAEALLTLLKHPLTHSGADRNLHQLHTQQLEMAIRDTGLPYPDKVGLIRTGQKAAKRMEQPQLFLTWLDWVADVFTDNDIASEHPLADLVSTHLTLANAIAGGQGTDAENELWKMNAGEKAQSVMDNLATHAPAGGAMAAADYADLIGALLSGEEVRDRDAPHPNVMIWGTLEARVQGADLVILGGLNDGTWPEAPPPDPWLNRKMRKDAGLLLPERRIGLSAHDYQQAISAREVWVTRAIRSDEAETVPSRWINRLSNLMNGLPENGGSEAWAQMRARGTWWLDQARALEAVTRTPPAPRPSPRPPIAARPRKLSVTAISQLIRDPYAIYAKNTLRLRPMNDLVQSPDAQLRGIVLHQIMERFVKAATDDQTLLTAEHLMATAQDVLETAIPWPAARMMWLARIGRVADWFVTREAARQTYASPVAAEKSAHGMHEFTDIGFTLHGYADRIDLTEDGDALIYDYKTGNPPTKKQQKLFDKQLLIEAAMVENGAFAEVGVAHVAQAIFIGLGAKPVEIPAPLDEESPAEVLKGLHRLISAYLKPDQGFTARRFALSDVFGGDYDQLARFGEWDGTMDPVPEDLK